VPGKTVKEARTVLLAVKILRDQDPSTEDQKLFMREIEAGCRAQHPTLLGFVSFNMYPYAIAMERGIVNLRKVLDAENLGRPYTYTKGTSEIVQWNDTKRSIVAFGVAVGMSYLHDHGIMHRDLKTENVMLDEDLYPRIADFGLSKVFGYGEQALNENRAQAQTLNVGTGCYMAPELFSSIGDGCYTPAIDVYAYGMLLYELVTLAIPWGPVKGVILNRFQLLGYLKRGDRPPLPDFVLPAYRQLIEKCWCHNPSDRPSFRDIIKQTRGQVLAYPDVDVNELIDYQERMLKELNESEGQRR
jgi:serine/threonine protein kinase